MIRGLWLVIGLGLGCGVGSPPSPPIAPTCSPPSEEAFETDADGLTPPLRTTCLCTAVGFCPEQVPFTAGRIDDVAETERGDLWVVGQGTLFLREGGVWSRFVFIRGELPVAVEARGEFVWVLTTRTLWRWHLGTIRGTSEISLVGPNVPSLFIDSEGRALVGGRLVNHDFSVTWGSPDTLFSALLPDDTSFSLVPDEGRVLIEVPGEPVREIVLDGENLDGYIAPLDVDDFWIVRDQDVLWWQDGSYQTYTMPLVPRPFSGGPLAGPEGGAVRTSPDGGFLIGARTGRLFELTTSGWASPTRAPEHARSLFRDASGDVLVTQWNSRQIVRISAAGQTALLPRGPCPLVQARHTSSIGIVQDPWSQASPSFGLVRPPDNTACAVPRGPVWQFGMGQLDQGVIVFDQEGRRYHARPTQEVRPLGPDALSGMTAVSGTSLDDVWFGSDHGALYHWRNGRMSVYPHREGVVIEELVQLPGAALVGRVSGYLGNEILVVHRDGVTQLIEAPLKVQAVSSWGNRAALTGRLDDAQWATTLTPEGTFGPVHFVVEGRESLTMGTHPGGQVWLSGHNRLWRWESADDPPTEVSGVLDDATPLEILFDADDTMLLIFQNEIRRVSLGDLSFTVESMENTEGLVQQAAFAGKNVVLRARTTFGDELMIYDPETGRTTRALSDEPVVSDVAGDENTGWVASKQGERTSTVLFSGDLQDWRPSSRLPQSEVGHAPVAMNHLGEVAVVEKRAAWLARGREGEPWQVIQFDPCPNEAPDVHDVRLDDAGDVWVGMACGDRGRLYRQLGDDPPNLIQQGDGAGAMVRLDGPLESVSFAVALGMGLWEWTGNRLQEIVDDDDQSILVGPVLHYSSPNDIWWSGETPDGIGHRFGRFNGSCHHIFEGTYAWRALDVEGGRLRVLGSDGSLYTATINSEYECASDDSVNP